MVSKFNRTDIISFFALKVLYVYATALGILLFTVTTDDKPHIRYSTRIKFLSIGFRILCLILYITLLPSEVTNLTNLTAHSTLSNFILIVFAVQFISITGFTIFLIIFHAVYFKGWVILINRAVNVIVRIIKLRQTHKVFTASFYMIVIFRAAFTLHVSLVYVPKLLREIGLKNYLLVMQWFSQIYLWIGTIIVLDACYVCYVAVADMFKNITDFLIEFEVQFDEAYLRTLSRSSRRRLFRNCCEQIEECTLIYSEINSIICGVQKSFQFIILFAFYVNFVSIVILLHLGIWVYLIKGQILTYILTIAAIRITEIVTLSFIADRVVRKSEFAQHINWENMCLDMDKRWNRAVEQFLSLLKFRDLKLDIFGLFQLNNTLSLRFLSVVVTYVILLVQFMLMGYFHEADYNFLNLTILNYQ